MAKAPEFDNFFGKQGTPTGGNIASKSAWGTSFTHADKESMPTTGPDVLAPMRTTGTTGDVCYDAQENLRNPSNAHIRSVPNVK